MSSGSRREIRGKADVIPIDGSAEGMRIQLPPLKGVATIAPTFMRLDGDKAYEALFEIGAQIQAHETELDTVLELIVEKAAELLDTDLAWLALTDGSGVIRVQATAGASHEAFKRMSLEVGRGVGGVALERHETIVVPDYGSYLQDTPETVRSAVTAEGLVSMICAPMLRDARMVGALYVGNRSHTEFGGREASLVSALAGQASIAIENSRLLQQLEAKNEALERSEAVHRRLTDASLQRTGLDGVAATLVELLGRGLVVEQEVSPPFRRVYGAEDQDPEPSAPIAPIAAGDEDLGRIVVLGEVPLAESGQRALEHGATVLAVELLKERAAKEVEWRLGGELLTELLERSSPVDRRLASRAARFGVDATKAHRIVVFEALEGEVNERALRMAAANALLPSRSAVLLTTIGPGRVVLALPEAAEERLDQMLEALIDAAGSCSVGLSRLTVDLSRGLREALACTRFATLSGGNAALVRADDFGAMRFLFALEDPTPIQDYVDEQLGPLLEYTRSHNVDLLDTLRVFLESDGHHPTIAKRCHIHKSTVKYRLARIAGILDRPLAEPEVRFELRLAVALADVLAALSFAPPLEAQRPA